MSAPVCLWVPVGVGSSDTLPVWVSVSPCWGMCDRPRACPPVRAGPRYLPKCPRESKSRSELGTMAGRQQAGRLGLAVREVRRRGTVPTPPPASSGTSRPAPPAGPPGGGALPNRCPAGQTAPPAPAAASAGAQREPRPPSSGSRAGPPRRQRAGRIINSRGTASGLSISHTEREPRTLPFGRWVPGLPVGQRLQHALLFPTKIKLKEAIMCLNPPVTIIYNLSRLSCISYGRFQLKEGIFYFFFPRTFSEC